MRTWTPSICRKTKQSNISVWFSLCLFHVSVSKNNNPITSRTPPVNTNLICTLAFFLFQRGPLTHRHSGCGCTACSAFPLECTVDPWWQGTGLPGSAAPAGTHTSTGTRRSTPTWDSLRARAHQQIPLNDKWFLGFFQRESFQVHRFIVDLFVQQVTLFYKQ